jgi:EmrB/QacA subfamily drug resistance transporter
MVKAQSLRASSQRAADPRRWTALAVLVCLQFMLILDATVVNVALPSIKLGLGFSQANLTWVVDAYLLAAGGFLLLGGRLADLLGRRRVFMAGAVAFAVGSFLSALAQDQLMLIASRAMQGLGEALAGPAALSIIAVLFVAPKERARALSIWGGLAGLGGAVGVLLGGLIVDLAGWRWIFWINLPVALAVLFATRRLVPGDGIRTRGGFDFRGAITATGGITALVYGLLEANRYGWASAGTLGTFVLGAALLTGFAVIEGRVRTPLLPLRFFRTRRRSASSGLMALFTSAVYSLFFLLTLYMQLILGWSPLSIGVAYLAFSGGVLVAIAAASQLLPRIGVRPVLVGGMTLAAAGFTLLTQLPVHGQYWINVLPAMLLVALGAGLTFVALTVAAVSDATDSDAGLASGMVTTAQQVGGALGLAVLVSVAASATSSLVATGHPAAVAQLSGTHLAFAVGAGILAAGAMAAALLIDRFKPVSLPTPLPISQHEGHPQTLVA